MGGKNCDEDLKNLCILSDILEPINLHAVAIFSTSSAYNFLLFD